MENEILGGLQGFILILAAIDFHVYLGLFCIVPNFY